MEKPSKSPHPTALNPTARNMSKIMYPPRNGSTKEAAPMNKLNNLRTSNEITVDHTKNVQKLPNGINLVTMVRPGCPQPIQVKLPLTGKYLTPRRNGFE